MRHGHKTCERVAIYQVSSCDPTSMAPYCWAMLELRELRWRQPNWKKRNYELHADDGRVIATLAQPSAWKRHAIVVIENRTLTIRPVGFLQNRIVARDEGTGVDVAEYQVSGKGALSFKTGRVFYWKRKSIWKSIHGFIAADNDEVVEVVYG